MSSKWEQMSLGDVCEIFNGGTPKTDVREYWDGDNLWITPAEMGGRVTPYVDVTKRRLTGKGLNATSARLLPPYSVILSCRAPIGHLVINTVPMATNQGCKGLVPREELHHKFLFYYLMSRQDHLESLGTGATFKELGTPKLKTVSIPLPPVTEQERIVRLLDEAFAGIEIAKANAEKNIQNARAVFESQLESIFSRRDGAEVKLQDVCSITSKLVDPQEEDFIEAIHVGAANIESNTGLLFNLKSSREEGLISGKFSFNETMVLYSKIRPYLRKVARPNINGICSADMYPLLPDPMKITRDYLFYLLLSTDFTEYAIKGSARAGMPKVNRDHLFDFSFYLPSLEQQSRATKRLDEIHEDSKNLFDIYERKRFAMNKLKQSFLDYAFSNHL